MSSRVNRPFLLLRGSRLFLPSVCYRTVQLVTRNEHGGVQTLSMVAMTGKTVQKLPRADWLIFFSTLFLVHSFFSRISSCSSSFLSTDEECAVHDGSCTSCIERGCVFCLSDVEDGHVFRPEDKLGERSKLLRGRKTSNAHVTRRTSPAVPSVLV